MNPQYIEIVPGLTLDLGCVVALNLKLATEGGKPSFVVVTIATATSDLHTITKPFSSQERAKEAYYDARSALLGSAIPRLTS